MKVTTHTAIEPDSNSLIILDRDNTLSQDFGPMNGESDCIIFPTVIEGLRILSTLGPVLAIATNQSYVGRGEISLKEVEAFHQKLLQVLNIHGIRINLIAICPHTPWDNCFCRKPKPGMLNKLVKVSNIQNQNRIFFIGDKDSDMEAAKNAGIRGFKSDAVNFLGICESIKILLSND